MPKISIIGIAGNSVFMETDHFHQKGETTEAISVFEEIGGKGYNQAVAARRMGGDVSFLCAIGDDENGKKCVESAKKENINATFAIKENQSSPLAFILTDKNGENRVTVHRGATLDEKDVELFRENIANADVLLLQNEVPESVNIKAAEIAKENGVKVILNPAPARDLSEDFAKNIYLIVPNEQEEETAKKYDIPHIVTTLGERGCLVDGEKHISARETLAVDTTGAGDTFCGILSICTAQGMSLEKASEYATVGASLEVMKKGVLNAIPKREDIENILKG